MKRIKMRRPKDAYYSPKSLVHPVISEIVMDGVIFECCNGKGDISDVLREAGKTVLTNDIDPDCASDLHNDATDPYFWNRVEVDWVVTNPPFSKAAEIVQLAYEHAKVGIAFFLRLSFLEPCKGRVEFLEKYPPNEVYVMPRISFTGDGSKDLVTGMWAVWRKDTTSQKLKVISRHALQQYTKAESE